MKFIITFLFAFIALAVFGQDSTVAHTVTITSPASPSDVAMPLIGDWFEKGIPVIMTLLINIFGIYSSKIPFFKKIDDVGLRVIAFAVLLGAGYIAFGGSILDAGISYLMSMFTYHMAVRPISRSVNKDKYRK